MKHIRISSEKEKPCNLPGDLQEDAINILSKTVSGMLGDLTRLMAETGEP